MNIITKFNVAPAVQASTEVFILQENKVVKCFVRKILTETQLDQQGVPITLTRYVVDPGSANLKVTLDENQVFASKEELLKSL